MDPAKEEMPSHLSGSSSVTASSPNDSDIPNVPQVGNNLKTGTKADANSGSVIINSTSNGKSSHSHVSDDDEGFLSGEEEFEEPPERPIEAEQVPVGKNSDGPFPGSSEISMPNAKKDGDSEVLVDDDVAKRDRNGVLDGEKGVEGEGVELVKVASGVGDSGGSSGVVGGGSDDSKGSSLEGKPEIPTLVENNPYLNLNESGSGGGIEGSTDEAQDKVAVNAEVDQSVTWKKEVEESKAKDENTATEAKEGVKKAATLSNDVEQIIGEKEKPVESEGVVADGVKLTPKGDSVVETINVDVVEPGVSVVGETAEDEAAEVEEAELPGAGGVTLDWSCDSKSDVLEDTVTARNNEVDNPCSEPATGYDVEQAETKPLQPTDNAAEAGNKKELDIGGTVYPSGIANEPEILEKKNIEKMAKSEIDQFASQTEDNGTAVKIKNDEEVLGEYGNQAGNLVSAITQNNNEHDGLAEGDSINSHLPESVQKRNAQETIEAEHEAKDQMEGDTGFDDSVSDGETDGMILGSSEDAKQFTEELERGSGAESSHDHLQRIDGQIVTDSDEEVDTDDEGEGKELFDSAALAALLKAATGAEADGGSISITSQDGSRLFSVERPAGLGSSLRSFRPTAGPNHPNIFAPSTLSNSEGSQNNLSDEEKKKLDKLQQIRVKFFRLVHRLSLSPDESVAAQVLYRLAIIAGRQSGQAFSVDAAKRMALELEAAEKDDLNFSVNILVLGKCGVGKSATINSIFGEEKALIDAFQPATTTVKEIVGLVNGVKVRVFDTPGLKCSVMEQALNRNILSSVKKFTKKNPPDIVLYVDRLDTQSRDLNDLPLLRTITSSLGTAIWKSAIVTLTHAASAPPDGPSGSPLSYEVFVTQRSHVVQQSIGHAVGDLRMMSPSLMNPVSLVENHPSCRKNREGHKVLPNGQSWRPQLLLLCYSMKILSEANSLSKPQDQFDQRKLFGFRSRSPPLPYMLSSMLQSRAHPKLSSEQGGDNGDSDIDLDDLSDIDEGEEDEYDQLPPFKPLRKAQIAKLSKEQRKAYFEEYDYRVKLLQKKQWNEELKRMREIKKKGKDATIEYAYAEEDADSGAAAPVAVPLPDMMLPPSFDSDNPAYRYRFLEPTSQFLARPVLDTHGWDHDCGYDGVNVEQNLAIASRFPAAVTVQITKDKKDFTISLDSSISAKHGENGSSMAGFDIQSIGKQLAYIVRGETKFKNLKKNKTAGGISVTFLGENVVTGVKFEDQITLGKQYVLVGSAGAVRAQHDTAYGANFELQRRELDYPIGQIQSTFSMSVIKWRGDLALGFNSLAQFSVGRGSKVAVRAGINNKLSGQITVRTSSSEHLSLALAAVLPTAMAFYKKLWPGVGEKYSIY